MVKNAVALGWLALSLAAPARASEHGEYLVQLLGCGRCHTEGALQGEPNGPWLAGSQVGIAYTANEEEDRPGIVFAGNLTPDVETGLGAWSRKDIVRMIRSGIDNHGSPRMQVMPWTAYGLIKRKDAEAIADYLQTLEPVRRPIPDNVAPGEATNIPYVRIGLYTVDRVNPSD
jgi:mono/diheme cytochrome c family protein